MATSTVLTKVVMTELQVVNKMLRAVDIAPVASLTGTVDLEVENAIERFSDINRSVQTMGWDFNTRLQVKYLRDVNNNITVGSNVMSIVPSGLSAWKDLVLRESMIFNRDPNVDSFTLTDDVELDIVELINFEDLPQAARNYISHRSTREHERLDSADDTKVEIITDSELRAWATLINDHSRASKETLENNPNVFSSIFGRE